MNVNGNTIPWALAISVLSFTFWLGGLSIAVKASANDINTHIKKDGHETAQTDIAKVQTTVTANSKAIDELKKELKEQARVMQNNQKEILKAIRENDE